MLFFNNIQRSVKKFIGWLRRSHEMCPDEVYFSASLSLQVFIFLLPSVLQLLEPIGRKSRPMNFLASELFDPLILVLKCSGGGGGAAAAAAKHTLTILRLREYKNKRTFFTARGIIKHVMLQW